MWPILTAFKSSDFLKHDELEMIKITATSSIVLSNDVKFISVEGNEVNLYGILELCTCFSCSLGAGY